MAAAAFGADADKITTIRIATPSWPGQTNEDGTGLFFDIVRGVYDPAGIKMEFEIVPWKRAEKMIESNEADAMLSALRRKGRLTPKYPMWIEYTGAVFKKDNITNWKDKQSLNGKKAVWLRGYDFHTVSHLKGITFSGWSEVDDYAQGWAMLDKNRADAYIDALADIEAYIKENKPDMNIYRVEIIWGDNAYMSFAKTEKSNKLIEIYDQKIIELFKSGELEKFFKKWDSRYSPDAWKE
jgi:polar amino acid transport system substrate-binding protein